ncbi:sugar metabolism transcriptional regulator [Endozoicomonas sp. OPT23]|uniref:FeoC-like transcriptional regulator n=1 Tax=Endozoicomonas sp. OPT23 TaxID=2072845 RepID=UPI00129B81EA|nr:sugar metabolism transcriptional regulator [Endozoicomonas sp. OPT23]
MLLVRLKDYIASQGLCSLAEISQHFRSDPDAVRGMLQHWLRKGLIACEQSGCQKGCVSCAPEQLEIYRWQAERADQRIPLCNIQPDTDR